MTCVRRHKGSPRLPTTTVRSISFRLNVPRGAKVVPPCPLKRPFWHPGNHDWCSLPQVSTLRTIRHHCREES